MGGGPAGRVAAGARRLRAVRRIRVTIRVLIRVTIRVAIRVAVRVAIRVTIRVAIRVASRTFDRSRSYRRSELCWADPSPVRVYSDCAPHPSRLLPRVAACAARRAAAGCATAAPVGRVRRLWSGSA